MNLDTKSPAPPQFLPFVNPFLRSENPGPMASADTGNISNLGATYGCLFVGALFISALWGAGCIQLYFYYEKFWKTDERWLKSFILFTWILDITHQALLIQESYMTFVNSMENSSMMSYVPRSLPINGFISVFLDCSAQVFFVRRIWYLSDRNRLLIAILLVAVLAQVALTTAYSAQIYKLRLLAQLSGTVHLELAMNCVMAFTETLLAVTMIWLLRRSRSGIQRTDSLINRLVIYTVGSGLIISLWAIAALIAAAEAPHSFIFLSLDLFIPKFYFNCMLALLNSRAHLREKLDNQIIGMSFHVEGHSTTVGTQTISGLGETSLQIRGPNAMAGDGLEADKIIYCGQIVPV